MEDYAPKRLALVLAVQAEIEGMKAHNQAKVIGGGEPSYNQVDFDAKAEELRNLAHAHEQQLFG